MARRLEFLFDLMSPYSYLAATQIEALSKRTGASIEWVPVFLPGVMKAVGNRGPTEVAPKAMYTFKDVNDWAKHYGLPPIILPDDFPFVAAGAGRLCLVAKEHDRCPQFALRMFQQIWHERKSANDEACQRTALLHAGLDADACLARAATDELRERLKANTAAAVERGAYGVPTWYVDGHEMFVGNDRLMFVEKALAS